MSRETDKDPSRENSDTESFSDGDFDDDDDVEENSTLPIEVYSVSGATHESDRKTCPICLEFDFLRSSECCQVSCCESCWLSHISNVIHDGRIQIPCISNQCQQYLSRETISDIIRNHAVLVNKYAKLYDIANENPRSKTCPHCSYLFTLDKNPPIILQKHYKSGKKPPKQVQCTQCSFVWCFRCSAPWHENLTCKQFHKGDKLLSNWIKEKNDDQWNARKCPSCSSVIQRAGGCPHMKCSSCMCEFCYLCGRRYFKIPMIGQHTNKFSVLGCPYNLHPEKPWLRRTIRGAVATGVVVTAPIILAGALTAAVTVLPSIGIYKAVKHVRRRRRRAPNYAVGFTVLRAQQPEAQDDLLTEEEITQFLAQFRAERENEFPLAIFADMDIEHLFDGNERTNSVAVENTDF